MILVCFLQMVIGADRADILLDQPPSAVQKDYAPADGCTVSVNPPPFIWVPPKDDLLYLVEIARSSDFLGDDAIRIGDVPISTLALRAPLQAGRWYWRYAIQQEPGKPDFAHAKFSRTRAFKVPEDAPVFPYPDLAAAVANIPKERPRLFFLSSELEGYRARVREGDLKDYPERVAKAYDKYIGVDLVPEPPYVTGKGPERGENYAKIFRATRPPMDRMEQSALAYLLTGESKYGQEAKRRILHFFSWDPEGSTQYWNNDEPAMWVMMRGVRAYDWTADLFSDDERAQVEPVMRIRAGQFYRHLKYKRRFHTNPHESHAGRTIGFLGEAVLAFAHEWPEARQWLDYVLTCYWNVYPAWGREDGGWHEGPGYYTAYMSFVLHFVTPLKKATGIDLMQKPFFQNTPYYLLYTNPPYAKISPFGDGESGGASRGRGAVMHAFSTLLRNPYARWYAEAQGVTADHNALGIVLKDDTLEAKDPAGLPQARYFPGVGLVSLHTALGNAKDDVHFLIHSDPYGPVSHAHADQNAFTLEAFGEALAIASGFYPWYGSNHHSKWSWESKSSNTITYNGGIGQKIRNIESKGAIVAFDHGRDYDYVAADATRAYHGGLKRFIRHVVHVRPGVFVMYDDVAAPEPCALEWRLHTWREMQVDQAAQRVRAAQGDARLDVQFFSPANLAFAQTDQCDPPPERGGKDQYHLVAATPEPVEEARFLTVLMPYKAGDEAALPRVTSNAEEGTHAVTIADAGGIHTVTFRTSTASDGATGQQCHLDVRAEHRTPEGAVDKSVSHRVTEMTRLEKTDTDDAKTPRVVFHVNQSL